MLADALLQVALDEELEVTEQEELGEREEALATKGATLFKVPDAPAVIASIRGGHGLAALFATEPGANLALYSRLAALKPDLASPAMRKKVGAKMPWPLPPAKRYGLDLSVAASGCD